MRSNAACRLKMTVKKCAVCKKKNGMLIEMNIPSAIAYHSKYYHASCFLSAQGTIHQEDDAKDVCEVGQCNAPLFECMTKRTSVKKSIYSRILLLMSREKTSFSLMLLAAAQWCSYLGLAVVLYYGMLARVFLSFEVFSGICVAVACLLTAVYRSNVKRLAAILSAFVYLIYFCDAERASVLYYDVALIPKIMIMLFLCERGLRVLMLLRIVNANHLAKEYGALLWTVQPWPFLIQFPMYGSIACTAVVYGGVVMFKLPFIAPIYPLCLLGGISWLMLLYPVAYRPRWRIHAEELVSLPF